MSRSPLRPRKGLQLPRTLQQQLGIEKQRNEGGRPRGQETSRKARRSAQRLNKKRTSKSSKFHNQNAAESETDNSDGSSDLRHDSHPPVRPTTTRAADLSKPTSTVKKPVSAPTSTSMSESSSVRSTSRSVSPDFAVDVSSRAFAASAAREAAEIAALEKKLGLKGTKRPKSFAEDGLDDLLAGLGDDDPGLKRKRGDDEWLKRKRSRLEEKSDEEEEEEEDDSGLALGDDSDEEDDEDGLGSVFEREEQDPEAAAHRDDTYEASADDFATFDSEPDEDNQNKPAHHQSNRVRENPYVAPTTSVVPPKKYVPPSMRRAQHADWPSLERLKRQLKGHLNKLSEANLVTILAEIEKAYRTHPRQDVTTVLIDLLLALFCTRSALSNTFVILHAAFSAAVYKVMGIDFGAELVSQLVQRFDQYYGHAVRGKEPLNLISLLSNLFIFHVVASPLIVDHIRLLLHPLTEDNAELLLRLIRDCGPQLRQDDPTSLRAIVQLTQKEAARMTAAGEPMAVRTKFMIETIMDLKNNKMRAASSDTGLSSEHITRMRKVLGSLNDRTLRASEPLRVTRDDLQESTDKGKWWLIGARWNGHHGAVPKAHYDDDDDGANGDVAAVSVDDDWVEDDDAVDLAALSRQYGMNTDVRRSIFVALLSAVDYQDAHTRLLKLRLKRSQEQEIPRVLLRCVAGETAYNHYYALVAQRLCGDRRVRKAFHFALWDFFRRLGENADADDEEAEQEREADVPMSELANVAKLYAHLMVAGGETIGVLKVLELTALKERTSMFVELLLIMIMTEAKNDDAVVAKVFSRAAEAPQMIDRLQFFIRTHVRHSDLVEKANRASVKRGCKIGLGTLRGLRLGDQPQEDGFKPTGVTADMFD